MGLTTVALISAGASILGGVSSYQAGRGEASIHKRNAQQAVLDAKYRASLKSRQNRHDQASRKAQLAIGGSLEGTPARALLSTFLQGVEMEMIELNKGEAEKTRHLVAASGAKARATGALLGGFAQAGGSLATAGVLDKAAGAYSTNAWLKGNSFTNHMGSFKIV